MIVSGNGIMQGRLPALDGLRTFAVLAVFIFHSATVVARGGAVGVDIFFVLSGFVITLLLLKEYQSRQRIDLVRFYVMRLARLWPALLVVCAVVLILAIMFPDGPMGDELFPAVRAAFYTTNIFRQLASPDFHDYSRLGHTWSLAVEEQFYLIWPLLFIVLMKFFSLRRAAVATLVIALLPVLLRTLIWNDGAGLPRIYNGVDTRADQLLVGCGLAMLITGLASSSTAMVRAGKVFNIGMWPATAVLVLVCFLLPVSGLTGEAAAIYWSVGTLVVAVSAGILIAGLATNPTSPLTRFLSLRWLAWVGTNLTYGIYLWHYPVLGLLPETMRAAFRFPLALVVTIALAYLSYRFVESPVRRLVREGFDRRRRPRTLGADPAAG